MRSAQVSLFIIDDLSLTKVSKHATKLFDARIVNQSGQQLKRLAGSHELRCVAKFSYSSIAKLNQPTFSKLCPGRYDPRAK